MIMSRAPFVPGKEPPPMDKRPVCPGCGARLEAEEWRTRYMGAGALSVKLDPHLAGTEPAVDVIITMYKDMTGQILHTGIDESEWLEE
jgi:hypothetical protein